MQRIVQLMGMNGNVLSANTQFDEVERLVILIAPGVVSVRSDETAQNRAQAEQFAFDVDAPGMVDVTNESYDKPADHQYTVSIDDVTEDLMACTCPHHVHRSAFCKHMTAVGNATDDGTLEAFHTVTTTRPNPKTAIVTASVAFRAGRA